MTRSSDLRDLKVGLCSVCEHVRVITSERGSNFYLCGAAKTDPRLSKYPRLPVTSCVAFSPVHPQG
ncbi:MAG: hypothetical protein ABW352_23250 [Polyangiales bacterium]